MIKKVVGIIFINKNMKLLTYLRDNNDSILYPNHWSFLGGHIEEGETILDALKREIKEEIDYEVNTNEIIYLGEFYDEYGTLVYMYKSSINKKLNELTLTEGQRLGYFDFEEIYKLKLPPSLKEFLIKNKNKIMG